MEGTTTQGPEGLHYNVILGFCLTLVTDASIVA